MPISIGLPFYNAEQFLADAIRSIFAQTYQEWELILVDDGSTDRSLEIAYSVKDPRVRVISDGENKKLPTRLNQIAGEAKYDFIGRMDADDLLSPRRFEKQMAVLDRYPEIDLVSTGVFSITDDLKPIGVRWHHSTSMNLKDLLAKSGCGVVHAALLGRRAWFVRNPYDASIRYGQDYELWLRSSARNDFNVFLMQEPLYFYREQNNVTAKKLLGAYRDLRRMYWRFGSFHLTLPLIIEFWFKSVVVRCLDVTDHLEFLLNRRSDVISPAMLDLFGKEIDQVLQTKVPGIDG